jgi:hypothetical protein
LKAAFFLLAAGCLLVGSCERGGEPPQEGGRTVEIVLKDVTVRQYGGEKQRFEFEARRLKLDEETEVLEAPQGVRGRIEAEAFHEEGDEQ